MKRENGKIELINGTKMLFVILSLFIIIHLLIGLYDFSFFRIPNVLLGFLLILYAFYAPIYMELNSFLNALLTSAILLVISFSLYGLKIIGAGDAKYIAVASLWFGGHDVFAFLLSVSVIGGGLSVVYLVFKNHIGRLSDRTWLKIQEGEAKYPKLQKMWSGSGAGPEIGKRENISDRMVPYGVAIAAGSIVMLWISPIIY